jgi:hypothetical protein
MPIYLHNNAAVAALANALDADPLSAAELPAVMGDRLFELLDLGNSPYIRQLEARLSEAEQSLAEEEGTVARYQFRHREEVDLIAKQGARIAELEAALSDAKDEIGALRTGEDGL